MSATPWQSPIPRFADFEQKICAHFGIAPGRYCEAVLRHTLHPHARLVWPLLRLIRPDFFAADHDFIAGLARLWRRRDFADEMDDFSRHPANRTFLRRTLRLRVSVRRVHHLVHFLLTDPAPDQVLFLRAPDVDAAPSAASTTLRPPPARPHVEPG